MSNFTGLTLEEAQNKYKGWLKAEEALMCAQSYVIEGRTLTKANLKEVAERLEYWEEKCNKLGNEKSGNIGVKRVVVKWD